MKLPFLKFEGFNSQIDFNKQLIISLKWNSCAMWSRL